MRPTTAARALAIALFLLGSSSATAARAQDSVDALLQVALQHIDAGRPFEAIDVLSRGVTVAPNDARVWFARSGVAIAMRRSLEIRLGADEAARKALSSQPHDDDVHDLAAALTIGLAFDDHHGAFDLIDHSGDEDAPPEKLARQARFAWLGYPDPNLESRPGEVASYYRPLLQRKPVKDADLGWHLEAAIGTGSTRLVAADCRRLIALGVEDSSVCTLLAWASNRLGHHDEALASCGRALASSPGDLSATFERGLAHAGRNEFELARADWNVCVARASGAAPARFGLVWLDLAEGRPDRASADLQQLNAADLESPIARRLHAVILLRTGRPADAIRELAKEAWTGPWIDGLWFGRSTKSHAAATSVLACLRPVVENHDFDSSFLRPIVRVDGTSYDRALFRAVPAARKRWWTTDFASSILDTLAEGHAFAAFETCETECARDPLSTTSLALREGIERGLVSGLGNYEYFDVEKGKQLDGNAEYLSGVYEGRTWLGCIPGGERSASGGFARAAAARPDSIEYALLEARYASWGYEKLSDWQEEYYGKVLALTARNDAELAWQAEARTALETHHGPATMEVDALTRRLAEHPDDANLFRARAEAFVRKGDVEAALADAERARVLAPRDLETLQLLNRLHRRRDEPLAMLTDCERALEIAPDDREWGSRCAWLLDQMGRKEEALQRIRHVLTLDKPGFYDAWFGARLLRDLGRRDEALAAFTHIIDTYDYPDLELERGELRFSGADFAGAITDFRAYLVRHPHDDHATSLLDRAVASSEGVDERTAREQRILAHESKTPGEYFQRADLHATRGEWQAAWDDFTREIELESAEGQMPARMHRASVGLRIGRAAESAQDCRYVLARKPEWDEFRDQLFDACMLGGDWDGAVAAADESLRRNPERLGPALFCKAITFHQTQNWPAAIAAWRKVLAYSPNNEPARAALSNALQHRACDLLGNQSYVAARDALDEAVRLTPGDALAYYNRGFARYHCGDWAAAQRDIDTATTLNSSLKRVEFVHKVEERKLTETKCPDCGGFGATGGGGGWIDERTSDTSTVSGWNPSTGYSSNTSITGSHGGFRWEGSSVVSCPTCNGTGSVWR